MAMVSMESLEPLQTYDDFVQRRGRWASQRSLDHYVQTAAAVLGTAAWSDVSRGKVAGLAALAPAYLART